MTTQNTSESDTSDTSNISAVLSGNPATTAPADTVNHAATTLTAAVHQDFRWVQGVTQQGSYAEFVERTLDITAGIHTCLQLVYASNLARFSDHDDAKGGAAAAIGINDGDKLMRLSIAASALLREDARHQVDCMTAYEAT